MTSVPSETSGSGPRVAASAVPGTMPVAIPGFRFSVAPMMDWTDRHCRAFHRVLTRRARLYTEMVTAAAILHGDRERLLGFDESEHPVAVQLGGSAPADLARAARICAERGYAEINLNIGCPSDRVQNGAFGACLMRDPDLVGACVAAMKAAVDVPVTVKCRLGVDDQPAEALDHLADAVLAAGADAMIVHARKAWLKGLSPRQNRDVPPLDYERVFALKRRLPGVPVALNGGLVSWDGIGTVLPHVDGVMIGRAAYAEPALLLDVDATIFGDGERRIGRTEALEAYMPYVAAQLAEGVPLHAMTRHVLGLFNGWPGARAFRRHLSVEGVGKGAGLDVLAAALRALEARRTRDEAA